MVSHNEKLGKPSAASHLDSRVDVCLKYVKEQEDLEEYLKC